MVLLINELKNQLLPVAGPRKKMLNYMRAVQSGGSPDQTSELKMALLTEQQNVLALQDKIKQDRGNELKNQQIIQVGSRNQILALVNEIPIFEK